MIALFVSLFVLKFEAVLIELKHRLVTVLGLHLC